MSKIILCFLFIQTAGAAVFNPAPTQDVLDNPHRGFMLWGSNVLADGGLPDNLHEANIYHAYLPWRMVETADQVFAWAEVEQTYITPIINDHPDATLVLRLVADYPDGPGSGLDSHYTGGDNNRDYPLFLEQPPYNITGHSYTSCNGDGPGIAPDWNDPEFINQAQELITAFGLYFDGDPRITAIQVGLIGLWGEWHQSGCESIAPEALVKNALKNSYDNAFMQTPLQTRYARDPDVLGVEFGFHEDYFPSFTANCIYGFPQCDDSGDWNLEYGLTNIVPVARNNWQVSPISGESPLSSQKNTWINDEADVTTVLNDYHFSFLGPAGKHEEPGNDAAMDRIANQLGYRFQVDDLTIDNPITTGSATIQANLSNVGSAPVYIPYHLAIDWVDDSNNIVATWSFDDDLSTLLPDTSLTLEQNFVINLSNNTYTIRLYLSPVNPAGKNIILANQNRDESGRVIIGGITVNVSDLIFADGFD
ncbi:MAG: DUF4832 domain-containing protein [Marinicella sp.]